MVMLQEKLLLYVDGDPIVADAVKQISDSLHLGRMIIAHSIEEAVQNATDALPKRMAALVFPTILPDGNGLDLLNARAGETKLFGEETAKVLVTADWSKETEGLYKQQGVETIIHKPIGPKELTEIVGEIVNETPTP